MSDFTNLLRQNRFRPADVPRFRDKLFHEGDRRRPYLERFSVLLFLATVIATAGVIGDSTATVIGAMIVAPLMTPIMATAAALIMGDMGRAARALALVGLGTAGVVLLSWLIGTLSPAFIDFANNAQITGRVSPRLIDLLAALASGAAGAFCLSREDVSDSLPGVAIAISLVPPLCVVGLALSSGEMDAALGAGLLFTTNFLAILLAGGAVLAFLGLNAAAQVQVRSSARRNAYIVIALATVLVAIPLAATGRTLSWESLAARQARRATTAWLAGKPYYVRLVSVHGDTVSITVTGTGEPPPFPALVQAVRRSVGRPVTVNLETIPAQVMSSAAPSP
jgi:uncharacterized hydrophobic protein (TIGR00271 family)